MSKTALLVGISGLGSTLYRPLAVLGYKKAVVTYNKNRDSALQWDDTAQTCGIGTTIEQLDATDPLAVKSLLDSIDQLDAVIALQGHFLMKPALEYTPEDVQAIFASNYYASYYLAKWSLPKLRSTNGSLVFFGVAHADQLHSQPMTTPYAAAKTALLVLMRSLARSEAQYGVRVNMISPGLMQNGKMAKEIEQANATAVPAGRIGTPEDVAGAVKYLLSEEANYVTGTNLILSGGWAI